MAIKKKQKKEAVEDEEKEEEELEKELEKEDEGNEDLPLDEKDALGVEEITNRLLRLQADFMNYKNRAAKDKKSTVAYATEELMSQILPVLDNFERALDSEEKHEGFYDGVKMIYDQLIEVLKKNGLEEIECLGEKFDPNFHHGVFVEECKGEKEGTILGVLQKGYTLNGKVIRPTMVKIAE